MKNEPTPADRSIEDELSLPLLMPAQKKHYLIALIFVLVLCVALLTAVLFLNAKQAMPDLPLDTDTATPPSDATSESSPPLSETDAPTIETPAPSPDTSDTPPAGTAIPAPTPIPSPSTSQTEPTGQEEISASTSELPPIVIEQVLLSGSAGLVYRSYGNGACMVESIGSCTDACLIIPSRSPDGDTVIAIGQNAFAQSTQLLAVQIPATVKSIGKAAFAGCDNLLFFTVAADNPAYCDEKGVLYSKDMASLLCYPSGRPCPEAVIPASVTYISAQAFGEKAHYGTVVFEGALSAWRNIHIEDGNQILYTLPKRFAP